MHYALYKLYLKKILMDILKIFIMVLSTIIIYLSFLFLGFNLRNKNIKAQGLSKKEKYFESKTFIAGKKIKSINLPWGKLGLSICYDLRFPNLFRKLAQRGAQIILMPAAFTVPSGKDHWEVMLRSRAIENSVFLVATDMCGNHHTNRKTYGHSLLVNPWGKIISKAKSKPKILNTNINLDEIEHARNKIPAILND